jgi:hypothetical protein
MTSVATSPRARSSQKAALHRECMVANAVLDLHVYLTEHEMFDFVRDGEAEVWWVPGIVYSPEYTQRHELNLNVTIPPALRQFDGVAYQTQKRHNLYAHVFLTSASEWGLLQEHHLDADTRTDTRGSATYNSAEVIYRALPLVRYKRRKTKVKLVKLGTGISSGSAEPADAGPPPVVVMPYFKPTLMLSLVTGAPRSYPRGGIPSVLLKHMTFVDEPGQPPRTLFQPILYNNEFWITSGKLRELNATMRDDSHDDDSGAAQLAVAAEADSTAIAKMSAETDEVVLPLVLSFEHTSFWAWSMQTQLEDQWGTGGGYTEPGGAAAPDPLKQVQGLLDGSSNASLLEVYQQGTAMMHSERETDIIREMLFETNPWLLAVTMVVSLLHSLFDILAFKNDIQFWRKRKSTQGLSLRSMLIGVFFHTVIFLYLLDSSEKTSTMVLISNGVGLAIEYWKLHRAFHFRLLWTPGRLLPALTWNIYQDSGEEAETEQGAGEGKGGGAVTAADNSESVAGGDGALVRRPDASVRATEKHDVVATTHLLYVIAPLAVGYAAYSYYFMLHKSYYSWVISSLVGFVYAFGFILMTPQIYINYRLKSVAHMPWKAMVYKSLNTFIDDLFAFIIKMPTMHRLACLRDDLIFFIYLYQRWIYPVDFSRVNEYGQESPEAANTATANTPATASGDGAAEKLDRVDDKKDK